MTDSRFDFRAAAERIATDCGTTVAAIFGPERTAKVAFARHALMAACHDAGWSMARIARQLAMDHSSVRHGLRRHRERQGRPPL